MAARPSSNEIRLTRVYDAPLHRVWDAWTVPDQIARWWGPRGFTLTTHHKDLRVGGTWRYTMHGPDGVDYPNLATYHVVEPHRRLVYDHGATDDTPPLFRVTATFTEADGQTTLDLVFVLATPEAAAEIAKHIRKAGGEATWDRLAEHLEEGATGKRPFVFNRTLAAPVAQVWSMWTEPAHLARWLPPPGSRMHFVRRTIAVGQSTLFVIEGEHGRMQVKADYLVLDPPRRIVYTQRFVDQERPVPPPGVTAWPATLQTTVVLASEAPDRTRVTVTCEPHGDATPAELEAFARERAGMTGGWSSSFDALEALLG